MDHGELEAKLSAEGLGDGGRCAGSAEDENSSPLLLTMHYSPSPMATEYVSARSTLHPQANSLSHFQARKKAENHATDIHSSPPRKLTP